MWQQKVLKSTTHNMHNPHISLGPGKSRTIANDKKIKKEKKQIFVMRVQSTYASIAINDERGGGERL